MTRLTRLSLILIAALTLALPQAASAAWSPPANVASGSPGMIDLDSNASGTAALAWSQFNPSQQVYGVYVSVRQGGSFGPAELVTNSPHVFAGTTESERTTGQEAYKRCLAKTKKKQRKARKRGHKPKRTPKEICAKHLGTEKVTSDKYAFGNAVGPQVAVTDAGSVFVVWRQPTSHHSTTDQLAYRVRNAAGSWGAYQYLTNGAPTTNRTPDAFGGVGDRALVTFSRGGRIYAATYNGGGLTTSNLGEGIFAPEGAFSSDGSAVVAWNQGSNLVTAIDNGSGFGSPQVLASNAGFAQVAGADNRLVVAWNADNAGSAAVYAAERIGGGSFNALGPVSPAVTSSLSDVAVGADGTAAIALEASELAGRQIEVAVAAPGGAFGAAEAASTPGTPASAIKAAVSPTGRTFVTWRNSGGANPTVQANQRPSGGSFAAVQDTLSDPLQRADAPELAALAGNQGVAVWAGGSFIQSSTFTP